MRVLIQPTIKTKGTSATVLYQCMSDPHIGAHNVDYKLIERELKEARQDGARIILNGDLFDLILPRDSKRFRLSTVHPRLYDARDNMIGAVIDWGEELFGPYADLIDLIGCGNHEDAITKYHGVDPTEELVKRLQRAGSKVVYGGYTGWIVQPFDLGGARIRHNTHYHHGAGGAAPTTKGIAGFARKNVWIDGAHLILEGHKHNRIISFDRCSKPPNQYGRVEHYDRACVMTGSYMDIHCGFGQEGPRIPQYAEDAGLAPQPKGGMRVVITAQRNKVNGTHQIYLSQKIIG